MEKFIEIIERWKFGDIIKSRVNQNLSIENKFIMYWNLLKKQLYLYEKMIQDVYLKRNINIMGQGAWLEFTIQLQNQ